MANPHTLPAALGAIAFLPTTAILGIHVILARSSADRASSVRTTAIVAVILEAVIFVAIPCLVISHIAPWVPDARLRGARYIWFGTGLFLCTAASAVSVATLVCLSQVVDDPLSTILDWRAPNFLVGSSVALGLAFASQLAFFISHLLAGRIRGGSHLQVLSHPDQASRATQRIKTIPYHETAPISGKSRVSSASFDSPTPPGSSGERSTTETMSSFRSSLSHVVRPITSKTRLLSVSRQFSHRPASLDLPGLGEARTRSTTTDGFDSWDTSAVDPENRQTVLESSSPPLPSRFLETIPASPTVSSRSTADSSPGPSPGTALQDAADLNHLTPLEPPSAARRRSRSYSPVSTRTIQAQRTAFTQQPSHSEAHIHPLFRSDSPVPPPSATPGTVVVAAPDAGRVISLSSPVDAQSVRSIRSKRRLRSESLPGVPSPLSRASSCEEMYRVGMGLGVEDRGRENSPEIKEEEDEAVMVGLGVSGEGRVEEERKMTPPIPDWILSAGCRSSLTVYNSRKGQAADDGAERAAVEQQV